MSLKRLFTLLTAALFGVMPCIAQAANPAVEKVHVIFKTHLDVGFTDLSSKVEQRYITEFIPKAIAVAEELRESGAEERYVWTTGSWLVWSFLEQASPEQVAKLEEAIRQGDIVWNGVPYTVESESMTKEHFAALLKLSQQLDKRFGKTTTAAKMTDVPGHTRSIVPLLANAGIEFLHIGVNPASTVPNVPALCRWRDPESGSEIILMYQKDYGSDIILPDGKTAMVVAFTGDNHGPHKANQVKEIFAAIQSRYPNAKLEASTLSAVANDITPFRNKLPVVTSEIGDTWIHGFGSSPIRMAKFRALERLYRQWTSEGRLDPNSDEALRFCVTLGLIGEHTWGFDVKTHLNNWDKYDFDTFQASRSLPAFQNSEASWRELDNYIDKAIDYLPKNLQAEAKQTVDPIGNPVITPVTGKKRSKEITFEGAIRIDQEGLRMTAGELSYQAFSQTDYSRFYDSYLTQRVEWALHDFGKLGLTEEQSPSASIRTGVQHCSQNGKQNKKEISCKLNFLETDKIDARVLPKEVYTHYSIAPSGKEIDLSVTLIDKPANRMPEAYWFSFLPENVTDIIVEKTGQPVRVLDVVEGGNRQMHGIDRYVDILTTGGRIRITSLDALLVTIGEKGLLNYSTQQPDIQKGIHFCLFNNVWGTNFAMWFEGSITYRFKIELDPTEK